MKKKQIRIPELTAKRIGALRYYVEHLPGKKPDTLAKFLQLVEKDVRLMAAINLAREKEERKKS